MRMVQHSPSMAEQQSPGCKARFSQGMVEWLRVRGLVLKYLLA